MACAHLDDRESREAWAVWDRVRARARHSTGELPG